MYAQPTTSPAKEPSKTGNSSPKKAIPSLENKELATESGNLLISPLANQEFSASPLVEMASQGVLLAGDGNGASPLANPTRNTENKSKEIASLASSPLIENIQEEQGEKEPNFEQNLLNTTVNVDTEGEKPTNKDFIKPKNGTDSMPDSLQAKSSNSVKAVSLKHHNKKEATLGGKEAEKEGSSTTDSSEKEASKRPKSAAEDPNFLAFKDRVKEMAAEKAKHEPAKKSVKKAQAAAVPPSNERESIAQAGQTEEMAEQKPGEFDVEAFKKAILDMIKLPDTLEKADNFEENNNLKDVKAKTSESVGAQKEQASGGIEETTNENPDVESVPERKVVPLKAAKKEGKIKPLHAEKAMPPLRSEAEVVQPLEENTQEIDQKMADAGVSDEVLANSNEPAFQDALNSKKEAKTHSKNAAQNFRQEESNTLAETEQLVVDEEKQKAEQMAKVRAGLLAKVLGKQGKTGGKDTAERKKIASKIVKIFEETRDRVNEILNGLDEEVGILFDQGAELATKVFEAHVKKEMRAYKKRRYSGLDGKALWLRDLFKGLPDKVNEYFESGKDKYTAKLDETLTEIAEVVSTQLKAAMAAIAAGKKKVNDEVKKQPAHLRAFAQKAANSIQGDFDKLEQSVNDKQEELIGSLADKYNESIAAVDEKIEAMKAANRGLVNMALDAVGGAIKTILNIKNMLMELLGGVKKVIGTIITDPVGFLKQLISGVGDGVKSFGARIKKHLTTGLVEWLTGSLGPLGIQVPENLFSLKGIFNLVSQILGLTWGYIRNLAVKLLGERVMSAIEGAVEIFKVIRDKGFEGIWEYLKEKFTDLKETVIGGIKQMVITKVIEAGIKWILGLMSPASAFVKAAMLIIDVVKFFIERGSQIMELVSTFIEGIKAIAAGNVAKVAETIERGFAKAIPVLVGFLAALVGVTGLTGKIKKIIKKIRKRIDKALKKIILRAKKAGRKILKKLGLVKDTKGKDDRTDAEKKKDLEDGLDEAVKFAKEPDIGKAEIKEKLPKIKEKYDMQKLEAVYGEVKDDGIPVHFEGKVNPDGKSSQVILNVQSGIDEFIGEKFLNVESGKLTDFAIKNEEEINKLGYTYVRSEEGNIIYIRRSSKEDAKQVYFNKEGKLEEGQGSNQTEKHNKYNPKEIEVSADGKELIIKYEYSIEREGEEEKETKNFTTTVKVVDVSEGKLEQSTLGENIALKDKNTYGNTNSVDNKKANQSLKDADKFKEDTESKFNASHILADWFQGSGYKKTLNLITASEDYNLGPMKRAERSIAKQLERREKALKMANSSNFITFDLRVTVEYQILTDNAIVEALNKELEKEEAEGAYQLLKSHVDPRLCLDVSYVVKKIYLNGLKNQKFTPNISANAGPDETLKNNLI